MGVSEFVCDDALEAKGEDVVSFVVIVEGVSNAVEEVKGGEEVVVGGFGEDLFLEKVIERSRLFLGVDDPFEVMEIAEGSGGFFDVGFLEKNGV